MVTERSIIDRMVQGIVGETKPSETKTGDLLISDKRSYTIFNQDKKMFLKFNVELEKMKFKKVIDLSVSIESLQPQDELTLVLGTTDKPYTYLDIMSLSKIKEKYKGFEISKFICTGLEGNTNISFQVGNNIYLIGQYLPHKNVVWLNMWPINWNWSDTFSFLIDTLKENYDRLKWDTKPIDRIQILCDSFLQGYLENLRNSSSSISNYRSSIGNNLISSVSYQEMSVRYAMEMEGIKSFINSLDPSPETKEVMKTLTKSLKDKEKQIKEAIEAFINSDKIVTEYLKKLNDLEEEQKNSTKIYKKDTFKQRITDLADLPFVKNLRITPSGEIRFEIRDVKIKYGKKVYNFGTFTVILTYNKIYFEGETYIISNGNRYFHPHIYEKSCCLGTFKPKMYDLLFKMKFADLAVLIKQFLNTYTPSDKYMGLEYFTGVNRVYQKFKNTQFGKDVEYQVGRREGDPQITTWLEKDGTDSHGNSTHYNEDYPDDQRNGEDE